MTPNAVPIERKPKALSTLSQKSATVAENGETTAKFGDCRTFLRQCGQALKERNPNRTKTCVPLARKRLSFCRDFVLMGRHPLKHLVEADVDSNHPYSTLIFGVFPLNQIARVGVSLRVIALPERYGRSDRRTNGQTMYCGITARCAASRGNKRVLFKVTAY